MRLAVLVNKPAFKIGSIRRPVIVAVRVLPGVMEPAVIVTEFPAAMADPLTTVPVVPAIVATTFVTSRGTSSCTRTSNAVVAFAPEPAVMTMSNEIVPPANTEGGTVVRSNASVTVFATERLGSTIVLATLGVVPRLALVELVTLA